MTISLIAVLIPLLFMADVVARLFREFAITLGITILLSAVVSLTLTPMQQWIRRGGLTLATVAGVLTLLTACTVGPDYVRPTVMAPIAYKEMNGWKVAQESVTVTTNQYKAGTVNYLNVVTVQATALTNETTAVQILGRRMTAAVLLVKALGGSWNVSALPSAEEVTAQETPAESRP